jgi:MFS family permease
MALLLVGLAASTVPAARWSARKGRRLAFVGGALIATMSSLAAAFAIYVESFWLFCGTTFALGFNQAFVQQYRFAAAEATESKHVGRAVSLVLLGTLVAAWLGPELAKRADGFGSFNRDAAGYVLLAGVMFSGAVVLGFLRTDPPVPRLQRRSGGNIRALFQKPGFVLAIAGAGLGYAVMVFVMTATPISMHVRDGHSMGHTAGVIQSHIVAMYLPSLLSGRLIERFGSVRIMWTGLGLVAACLVLGAVGREVSHYWSSLVLLGVGWNFLFVGATSLLVSQYEPEEKGLAEAVNDFCVFTLAALGSLLSGTVMEWLGWRGLLAVAVVPTALLGAVLLWYSWRSKVVAS